jgi:hypothetical protein
LLKKIGQLVFGVLAPEIVVLTAAYQIKKARRAAKEVAEQMNGDNSKRNRRAAAEKIASRPCNHPSIGLANLAMTSMNTLYAMDG